MAIRRLEIYIAILFLKLTAFIKIYLQQSVCVECGLFAVYQRHESIKNHNVFMAHSYGHYILFNLSSDDRVQLSHANVMQIQFIRQFKTKPLTKCVENQTMKKKRFFEKLAQLVRLTFQFVGWVAQLRWLYIVPHALHCEWMDSMIARRFISTHPHSKEKNYNVSQDIKAMRYHLNKGDS